MCIRDSINVVPVSSVDSVLKIALTKELKPVDWVEVETISKTGKNDKPPIQTH